MSNEIPQIARLAEQLLVEIEQAVSRFSRRHKYVFGVQLRQQAWKVTVLTHRAWRDRARQADWTSRLSFAIDDLKLSMQLGNKIAAFVSFQQFEALARLVSQLGRQCGGWQKQQHSQRQNGPVPAAEGQRPQILSARAASREASK